MIVIGRLIYIFTSELGIIYEPAAFKTRMYRGDAVYDYHSSKRYNVPLTSFFVGDYLLYISLYKIDKEEIVYLKITLSAPD